MTSRTNASLYLGLGCVVVGLLAAFVWIPLDTETGLIERVRRRVSIGDALAPTVAAAFLGLGGLMVLLSDRGSDDQPALTPANLRFALGLLVFLAAAFTIMRWTGPMLASIGGAEDGYRLLRDTAPWKWSGFALGGFILVTGLITFAEARLSWRGVLVGLAAVVVLIAIFDLPFDDLLLPPNGDV